MEVINRKLVYVEPGGKLGSNKFHEIFVTGDTFYNEYGRVDKTRTRGPTKSIREYEKFVNDKIKKGYKDITQNVAEVVVETDTGSLDPKVQDLVDALLAAARQKVAASYTIAADKVTDKQVQIAQDLLDSLNALRKSLPDFNTANGVLKELYTILPRRMANVNDHFLKGSDIQMLTEIIQKEQQLLDTLKSQVTVSQTTKQGFDLSEFGIEIEVASSADRSRIRHETDFRLGQGQKVWKVTNRETEKRFNPKKLKTKLLYHGSKTANYWSILTTGLKIRPAGVPTTGSMFGNGIYGADKAQKSIGYTSLEGTKWANGGDKKAYLCIFEFATGKEWAILGDHGQDRYSYRCGDTDYSDCQKHGADSVFAYGDMDDYNRGKCDLRLNEYIVYKPEQCTIRYIIELTK
jgi:poly [ADP-ribose] polymerase